MLYRSLLIIIFIFSCNQEDQYEKFWSQVYSFVVSSEKIKILNSDINSGSVISFPPNVWLSLLQITNKHQDFCLLYKTPFNQGKIKSPGILRWVEIGSEENCIDKKLDQKVIIEMNVLYLSMYFEGYKNKEKFKPRLEIKGEYEKLSKNKTFHLEIPLFNILYSQNSFNKGSILKSSSLNQKFSSSSPISFFRGLRVYKEYNEGMLIGQDDFDLQKLCHELNKNCENEIEFNCHRCKNAWTELIGGKCSSSKNKVCGHWPCDKVGNPACFRGRSFLPLKIKSCKDYLKASFCVGDLKPVCYRDYVLCQ